MQLSSYFTINFSTPRGAQKIITLLASFCMMWNEKIVQIEKRQCT